MNPPTSGHLKLIFELMTLARENNLDNIGIVLSPSEDNKNPLSCYRKKQYILEMVSSMSDIKTNIICKETGFPMSNIYELLNESGVDNNSKMLLIIGEDRLNDFNWLKKYYPNLDIRALDRPEGAMSATTIRGYVSGNNKNAFNEAYVGILQQDAIDELYNEVASELSKYSKTAPSSSKKSKKRGGRKPRQTKRKRVKNSKKHIPTRY
jgi:nicotinic acid mononucleotide adenylyltransferase